MKRFHKPINFNQIIGSELDMLSKTKLKKATYSQSSRVNMDFNTKDPSFVDLRKIIHKSKCQSKGIIKRITISHLSPSRSSDPNLKGTIARKNMHKKLMYKTANKFADFIDNLKGITKEKQQQK